MIEDFTGDGVERNAPGEAPTAFRIWRAGVNQTDIGPCNLTAAALARLLDLQAAKGVRYSFDLAHGTIDKQAPRDRQVAIGDHRLEGRNGELWAVDCQWSDWARTQIEQKPVPGLRYYSPAYDVDKATREPTRYLNCALTPNPATWNATALAAAAKGTAMDPEKDKPPGDGAEGGSGPSVDVSTVVAGLHKLMTEAKDDSEREMYRKALAALMAPKEGVEGAKAAEEGGDDKAPPSSKDGGALARAAAPAPEKTASADVSPAVLQLIKGIGGKVTELATKIETRERTELAQRATAEATERASLAGRKGLSVEVVTAIKNKGTPLDVARVLASMVKLEHDPRSLAGLPGGTQGSPETAIAQLPTEQTAMMHAQMGITPAHAPAARVDELGQFHRPTETPRQARERLAAAEKGAAR